MPLFVVYHNEPSSFVELSEVSTVLASSIYQELFQKNEFPTISSVISGNCDLAWAIYSSYFAHAARAVNVDIGHCFGLSQAVSACFTLIYTILSVEFRQQIDIFIGLFTYFIHGVALCGNDWNASFLKFQRTVNLNRSSRKDIPSNRSFTG